MTDKTNHTTSRVCTHTESYRELQTETARQPDSQGRDAERDTESESG